MKLLEKVETNSAISYDIIIEADKENERGNLIVGTLFVRQGENDAIPTKDFTINEEETDIIPTDEEMEEIEELLF